MSILGAPAWLAAFIIASSMLLACLGACALSGRISREEEIAEFMELMRLRNLHGAEHGEVPVELHRGQTQ